MGYLCWSISSSSCSEFMSDKSQLNDNSEQLMKKRGCTILIVHQPPDICMEETVDLSLPFLISVSKPLRFFLIVLKSWDINWKLSCLGTVSLHKSLMSSNLELNWLLD